MLIMILVILMRQSQQLQYQIICPVSQINIHQQQIMDRDRKEYTPTKASKIYAQPTTTAAQGYTRTSIQSTARGVGGGQMALLKQYQALKGQIKVLEVQNRQLSTDVQKLRYQKNLNQNKYLQKVSFEEEAIAQFQKEKNYQLELLKIKGEEELNRVRRQFQVRVDDLHRQIKNRDYLNRQAAEKISYLELKNGEFKKQLDKLEIELGRSRQANSQLTQTLTKQQFSNKKLEMLADELERQKCEMEAEIHVLLDIQAEKSRTINSLEVQLHNSENTQRCLQQKLLLLTDNFATLEQHIAVMKERLLSTEGQNDDLAKQLHSAQLTIQQKDNLILQQKEREVRLREELEQHQGRQMRREKEVAELMAQNQRLYRQLNINRHKLHELCISQGIDI